jgi:hypothetical protein
MANDAQHARTLRRCANTAFLVVGAVSLLGGGGIEGCSSKSPSPSSQSENADGGVDSGGSYDSGSDASSRNVPDGSGTIFSGGGPLLQDASSCAGGACNSLVITDAPVVEEVLVSGSPPAFTGGTVVSGTYYLTSVSIYGADAGAVVSEIPISEDGGSGSEGDASGEDAAVDGASVDGATVDGAISDAAATEGGASIGTPNGSFVEMVFFVGADATLAQIASANGNGCTLGTVNLSTAGNLLTMAPFCGNPFSPNANSGMTWPYTATATTIAASVPVGGGATAVLTLTLQ